MKQIITIWMQPIYLSLNNPKDRSGRLLLLIPPVILLIYFALNIINQKPFVFKTAIGVCALGFGVCLLVGLVIWYSLLGVYAAVQNTQANACLVPNIRRYLHVALLIPILVFPAIPVLISSYFSIPKNGAFIWLMGIIMMLACAIFIRFYKTIFFLFIAFYFLNSVMPDNEQYLHSLLEINWFFSCLIGIFLSILTLHFLLKPGLQISIKGNQWIISTAAKSPTLLSMQPLERLSIYQLNRHPTSSVLMRISFFRYFHWSQIVSLWLIISIGSIFAYIFFQNSTSELNDITSFQVILSALFPISLSQFGINGRVDLIRSQGEQALFSLTTSAPSCRDQIRNIYFYLIRQFLFIWSINYFIMALAVTLVIHQASMSSDFINYIHLIYLCQLPLCHRLLQNYANIKDHSDPTFLKYFVICGTLLLLTIALKFYVPAIPIYVYAITIVTGTVISLLIQWRKMMKVEVMFPVGRAA